MSFLSSYSDVLKDNKSDREELVELLKIVNSATDENQKNSKIVAKIDKVSGAVLKNRRKIRCWVIGMI